VSPTVLIESVSVFSNIIDSAITSYWIVYVYKAPIDILSEGTELPT